MERTKRFKWEGIPYCQLKWRSITKAINLLNIACIAGASIEFREGEEIIIKPFGVFNVLGSKINKWVFRKKMSTYQIKQKIFYQ